MVRLRIVIILIVGSYCNIVSYSTCVGGAFIVLVFNNKCSPPRIVVYYYRWFVLFCTGNVPFALFRFAPGC